MPIEYRPYVEEGISEWNKAFEKIGFRNAIAVRWQESGRDEFDPEDTNYCTFRWITSDKSYADSCLRANPMTGEMIDGDVVFDASFIRYWKDEYALLVGSTPTAAGEHQVRTAGLRRGDQPDPGLQDGLRPARRPGAAGIGAPGQERRARWLRKWFRPTRTSCSGSLPATRPSAPAASASSSRASSSDFALAAIALADAPKPEPPKTDKDKDKDKAAKKPEPKPELPEEFIGQAIKDIVMHEVGHSLGLRHNFKASTMLTATSSTTPASPGPRGWSAA